MRFDLSDSVRHDQERAADKRERYAETMRQDYKSGEDVSFLDYLDGDEQRELLNVLRRCWRKLDRCGLSSSNGGGYDDLLVRRDAVEAIDVAWDAAIEQSIANQIARGYAHEYEPDENPHD